MAQLSRLSSSLTRLHTGSCPLPAVLLTLTRLQHLYLWECRSEGEGDLHGALEDALPHLQQLTHLVSSDGRLVGSGTGT